MLYKTYILIKHYSVPLPFQISQYLCRDAKVHRIRWGWLSHQHKTFISQTAILSVNLKSRGKYHWGENYATQTRIKELTLLLEILKNPRFVCRLFILKFSYINGCLPKYRLTICRDWITKSAFPPRSGWLLFKTIWFIRIYIIRNSSWKMAIMNVTSSFVGVSNNPPTIMQQGLYNSITPIKFQTQEKEDQRSKWWSNCNS